MRLSATDFALPAAIFCSFTSGIQKLVIFGDIEKFELVMLTILAAAKNFAVKLKTYKTFIKLLYKITVSGAAAAARSTNDYDVP